MRFRCGLGVLLVACSSSSNTPGTPDAPAVGGVDAPIVTVDAPLVAGVDAPVVVVDAGVADAFPEEQLPDPTVITLTGHAIPEGMLVDPATHLLYANGFAAAVSSGLDIVDLGTDSVTKNIPLAAIGYGMALDGVTHRLFVGEDGGAEVIDTQNQVSLGRIPASADTLIGVAVAADTQANKIYVQLADGNPGPTFDTASVLVIDGSNNHVVTTIPLDDCTTGILDYNTTWIQVDETSSTVYVLCSRPSTYSQARVYVIDGKTNTVSTQFDIAEFPRWMAIDATDQHALVVATATYAPPDGHLVITPHSFLTIPPTPAAKLPVTPPAQLPDVPPIPDFLPFQGTMVTFEPTKGDFKTDLTVEGTSADGMHTKTAYFRLVLRINNMYQWVLMSVATHGTPAPAATSFLAVVQDGTTMSIVTELRISFGPDAGNTTSFQLVHFKSSVPPPPPSS